MFISYFEIFILLLLNNLCKSNENEDLRLIKEFSKTWNIRREVTYNDDMFVSVPRKYDKAIPIKGEFGCQEPGYTGQHCEFPICVNRQLYDDDNNYFNVLVDFRHLLSCNKMVPLYIDSTIESFTIECHSEVFVNPKINLYDVNATLINSSSNYTDDKATIQVTYDYVKPGIYQIIPSTNTNNASCFIYVSAKAQGHVDIGFVPRTFNDTIDPERNDKPNKEVYINTLSTVVAHTVNIPSPGSISTVSIYQYYNTISRPQKMGIRYGCKYEYFYNSLYCYDDNKYFLKIEGYDFFGNSFSRIKSFSCLINSTMPTSSPTKPSYHNPEKCQNGGTLITTRNNTKFCYCDNFFTSFDCSTRVCFNKGLSLPDGSCECKDGFVGKNCEHVICKDDSGYLPNQSPNMLIFVIRVRKQMISIINQIKETIKKIFHDYDDYKSRWFERYGVVIFNNYDERYEKKHFVIIDDFLQYLDILSKRNDDNGDCYDNFFEAIGDAIQTFAPPARSPIYVFSDGLPNDLNYYDNIIQVNSFYSSPIYFYIIQPQEDSGCGMWDFYSPTFQKMKDLAEKFSGSVFPVYNYETDDVQDILYIHLLHTYLMSSLMYVTDADICNHGNYNVTISINSKIDRFAIIAVGIDLDVHIYNPKGDEILPGIDTLETVYIWTYDNLELGQWSFNVYSVNDYSPCSVRAYSGMTPSEGFNKKKYNINWGFTTDLVLNSPNRVPMFSTSLSFVAHIDNYEVPDLTRVDAELIVHSKDDGGMQVIYASNGIWRDKCIYEIYFEPFKCRKHDENLFFTLFVKDKNGFYVQRAGSIFCTEVPFIIQPLKKCLNGGFILNNTCVCPYGYEGENCEKKICFNKGFLRDGLCICAPFYAGQFCEIIECKGMDWNSVHSDNKIIFLLDTTGENSHLLYELSNYSDIMIRNIISQNKGSIKHVVVIGFYSRPFPYVYGVIDVHHLDKVKESFYKAYRDSQILVPSCVKVHLWKAMELAISLSNPGSEIVIFQSSIPLEDDGIINEEMYKEIYNKFIEKQLILRAFIGVKGKLEYNCNGPPTSFARLHSLAIQTHQSNYLEVSKYSLNDVPKIVSSFISTGIVYKKYFNDCKQNCSIYFPIDSHTINVQLKVESNIGFYETELLKPDGSVVKDTIPLISDPRTGLTIIETRQFCPDGWVGLKSLYCMQYVGNMSTWQEAHDYCSNKGSFIIDIFGKDEEILLEEFMTENNITDLWIGLSRIEVDQMNIWSWDRGKLPSVPLKPLHYVNWAPNVTLNDDKKKCAYKINKWDVDDCNVKRRYICKRYKYEDSYNPSLGDIENLPPGKWWFNVKGKGPTSIEIRVESEFQIYLGFQNDIHNDKIIHNANSLSKDLRIATHLTSIDFEISETQIKSTQMFTYNNKMFYAVNYEQRFGCFHQYLSETFQCPDSSGVATDFYALTYGYDELGYTIQRYSSHKCVKQVPTCENKGILNNFECFCDEYHDGLRCENTICFNNGTYNEKKEMCDCPIGYDGEFCQYPSCINFIGETHSEDKKALVFVVENTIENIDAINSLKNNIYGIFMNIDEKWFDDYMLVTFDSTNNTSIKHDSDVEPFFINHIKNITPKDDTKSCELPILNAIMVGLNEVIYQQSVVYVISRAMPSDLNREHMFGSKVVYFMPQLYYHKVSDNNKCEINYNSNVYRVMLDYTIGSGGNFFITTGTNVGDAMLTIIPSLYHGAALVNPTFVNFQCSNDVKSYFNVDSKIQFIYIYVYGQNPLVSVHSPSGRQMTLELPFEDSDGKNKRLHIYRISDQTEFGMYSMIISSQGVCNVQVRGTKTSQVYFDFVPSVSNNSDIGKHLDNSTSAPTNTYNQVVATITGDIGELTYLELHNFETFETQYLKLYERKNCSLEYYSDPFKCESSKLFLKFYGIDTAGSMIVRESMTICTKYWNLDNTTTTPVPPYYNVTTTNPTGDITTSGTTKTGTFKTKSDIYFLLDTSSNVPANLYANFFTENLRAFFNNFIIDQNYVNVAFAPVPGDDNLLLLYPSFNTFKNVDTLMSTINSSFFPFDGSQSSGQQNLAYLTEMAISSSFLNTGYSSSSKPHILLYVTTKSSPGNDAIKAADQVKNSGKFKIISIAYQPGNNLEHLKKLSDCMYTVMKPDEFLKILNHIATQISYFSQLGKEMRTC